MKSLVLLMVSVGALASPCRGHRARPRRTKSSFG